MFQGEFTATLAGAVLTLAPKASLAGGPHPRPTAMTITFATAAAVPSYLKGTRIEVHLIPHT
jgi:hypothetical protein